MSLFKYTTRLSKAGAFAFSRYRFPMYKNHQNRWRYFSIGANKQLINNAKLQERKMEAVRLDKDKDLVTLNFHNAESVQFPYAWLRDNCQCRECYHPVSHARLFLMRNLDPDIRPLTAEIENKADLIITWPDQHQSRYTSKWLFERAFNSSVRQTQEQGLYRPERLWTSSEMGGKIPTVNYDEFIDDDQALLSWLLHVEQDGICLLTGAPTRKGIIGEIGNRVAYSKNNFYGKAFQVENKQNPNNVAYTSACLGLHTDQPQLHYTPGVQFLHCIKQAGEGGENIFADGFKVAKDMQHGNAESFQVLCKTAVNFQDEGVEGSLSFNLKTKMCTFEHDDSGKMTKVNYNNQVRDSRMLVPVEDIKPFYKAITLYEQMLMDPKYCIRHRLGPGEVVCFHNYRVMHGREEYFLTNDQHRLLEGGYVDWDEMRSRRRVVEQTLQAC